MRIGDRPGDVEDIRIRIDLVPFDHPHATPLVEEGQRDEIARYGEGDMTPIGPAEFVPPNGAFVVGYLNGVAVACGGWRARGDVPERGVRDGDAELKRMYVAPSARRRGVARAVLAEVERTALAAGRRRIILETGYKQPEALAFYRSAGYGDVPRFGYYADDPDTVHLGKELTRRTAAP